MNKNSFKKNLKKPNEKYKKEIEKKDKIIETLYKELERKNKIIEKLKEHNHILMKTALKNAEENLKDKISN